jgi:EAL domain-containing protein (putative c-di-GMP-specific phosphodiesterase class I)
VPITAGVSTPAAATDGVRLLSQRPSVLHKVAPFGGPAGNAGDAVVVAGPGWEDRLKDLLGALTHGERAALFAVRLSDYDALPLPAATVLDRARTDWLPEFLSFGKMFPHFQPIVDLSTGRPIGREALMRGKLGAMELRGGELFAAAEAHDALFSFDARARAAAITVGLPLLPAGEKLFVNLDPRAVIDVQGSLQTTWPVVERVGGNPAAVGIEFVQPERCPDPALLSALAEAHREQGATIVLDDLSGGGDALAALEAVRPDIAKLDAVFLEGVETSEARRRLVAAIVECAHEQDCLVVAEGVERVGQFEAVRELGVDFGQGFYFGQPTERPLEVDPRLVRGQIAMRMG